MSNRSGFERLVWFYSLSINSRARTRPDDSQHSSILPVKSLIDLEEAIISKKYFEHAYTINTRRAVLTLQDIQVSHCEKYLTLLVNISDTAGATKVIKDNESHSRREFSLEKGKDQGFEYSSHILISRTLDTKKRHLVLVEKSPLLSTHYLELFLNKVLFEIAKENESDYTIAQEFGVLDSETGKVRNIRYKPIIGLESKPDEDLMEAIRLGNFSSITLVSREEKSINGTDSNVEIIETQREVRLSTKFTGSTGSFFNGIKQYYKNDFDTVKVSYKSGGVNSSANFDVSNISVDGLEKAVTKKVLIDGFNETLKDAYTMLSNDIIEKMLEVQQ
ncbi:hypothetical protein Q4601_09065 [Shewanella sp. 1_MG-2023]|uniref:hypothetical protein n=1 Tax=unclassified Shewanella TaxID=196818 RepID=UPI0026E11CE1|nr:MULTISPECIES: hypothetical protein [unclassified Shewanella]MDO6610443.1 hypothetical protein [Shewanella sp. 7_MG-2023]MDO6770568.1 hypothetical protein [Shewanella sp. 2_MG-2023]MDO6794455.1 hypothetical protein [Shewanella sp. 1_MG-2023]